jgi:(p)ppGpp synthase/HD superfamily hydrolase
MLMHNAVLLESAMERFHHGSLEEAILLASLGHIGQTDRGGHPYILHPMAVMERVKHHNADTATVAILHDVMEDCHYCTEERLLQAGFKPVVVEALTYLVRPREVSILDAAQKLAVQDIRNPAVVMAMRVKIADYLENMRLDRLPVVHAKDIARTGLYGQALQIVSKALARAE